MSHQGKILPKEQQDIVMTASLCACRCLTDTLVQVLSGVEHEQLEVGSSVRQQVFGLVCQHLSALAFPRATGEQTGYSMFSHCSCPPLILGVEM